MIRLSNYRAFTLICTGYSKDISCNYLHFYMENRSEKDCVFNFEKFSFDDKLIENAFQFESLSAGSSMEIKFAFSESAYGDIFFDQIKEISFVFSIKEESSKEFLVKTRKAAFAPVKKKVADVNLRIYFYIPK